MAYSPALVHLYPRWTQNCIDSVFFILQDSDAFYEARPNLKNPAVSAEEKLRLAKEYAAKAEMYHHYC